MTEQAIMRTPPGFAERPAFQCGDERFSWAEVHAASRLRGTWQAVEDGAVLGLACIHRMGFEAGTLAASEVVAATTRFRHERNLLSGDELEAWLEHWGLSAAAWRDYFRRALLRERWASDVDETARKFVVHDEELAEALWAEAICSGALEAAARRLAGDAGLAAATEVTPPAGTAQRLALIQAAADEALAAAGTVEAIEREVAAHQLDWLRLDGWRLNLPNEDQAREAAMCVRQDGQPLAQVAADCAARLEALQVHMSDADGELGPLLLAAREGELIGPIAREGSYSLMVIDRKVRPDRADPETQRRATESVSRRAVERAISMYITFNEPF